MQPRTIVIQITLNPGSSRLETSLGLDIESFAQGSDQQRIADLLMSLCRAFEINPRGVYSHIWN